MTNAPCGRPVDARPELTRASSLPCNVEITHAGADKGAGLTWLCHYLGFSTADAVAFGDSSNDIAMLRAAGDGRTVRVYVPADYTIMPASVMETIRTLGKEITIDLRWNGQRLIITPQTALQRPARKAFWTLSQLCEEYAR